MFFFLPFRAKNPPERFPYVTLFLIAVNTLVFGLTSDGFWELRPEYLDAYAVNFNNMFSLHLFTALFLHGSLLHLAGNMLFLWIFGASLEGRLRPLKFSALYLAAGVVGNVMYEMVAGYLHPESPLLGASGAIMGLAGGYLYTFPYSEIRVFWALLWYFRISEIQARWVVLYYIAIDFFSTLVGHRHDGVAHLAHLGGFGAGLLMARLFRVERDTEDYSTSQAIRADVRDYNALSVLDLEPLLQRSTQDVQLILVYCEKSIVSNYHQGEQKCAATLVQYHRLLDEQADPVRLASLMLRLSPVSAKAFSSVFYLHLGSRLERAASYDLAVGVYCRIYELDRNAPDCEVALFRLARLYDKVYHNAEESRNAYNAMRNLFPNGRMSQDIPSLPPRAGPAPPRATAEEKPRPKPPEVNKDPKSFLEL